MKDIDFDRREIVVRDGKGAKDRLTMLPEALVRPLREHLDGVRAQHDADLSRGMGRAPLPGALERKYPNAALQWGWQWVFPATSHYLDGTTGQPRPHFHESAVQKGLRAAALARASPSTPPTPSATPSPPTCLRTVQELLGHRDVRTTQVYTCSPPRSMTISWA